jgi:hypothetical protein
MDRLVEEALAAFSHDVGYVVMIVESSSLMTPLDLTDPIELLRRMRAGEQPPLRERRPVSRRMSEAERRARGREHTRAYRERKRAERLAGAQSPQCQPPQSTGPQEPPERQAPSEHGSWPDIAVLAWESPDA